MMRRLCLRCQRGDERGNKIDNVTNGSKCRACIPTEPKVEKEANSTFKENTVVQCLIGGRWKANTRVRWCSSQKRYAFNDGLANNFTRTPPSVPNADCNKTMNLTRQWQFESADAWFAINITALNRTWPWLHEQDSIRFNRMDKKKLLKGCWNVEVKILLCQGLHDIRCLMSLKPLSTFCCNDDWRFFQEASSGAEIHGMRCTINSRM